MPSNLIQTKLMVPPLRPGWVKRPHLVAQLNSGLERKLILVSAPAGYGKSTLLSEWIHQVSVPIAWLTLESADNSPAQFWSYFISALESLPGFSGRLSEPSLITMEGVLPASALEDALSRLVDGIAGISDPFVLVLDDLHLITNPVIHQGLTFLLEHLPATENGLHLTVASRQDPPWPLARMRARAQTTELRTRDLRFTLDEATSFLNQVMGLRLSTSEVSLLDQRTEGWVAGLQMAALSMQKQEDIPAFLEKFSGSHRYILDYLTEDVLNQQSPRIMEFLLKTSILDKLTAPLCDAVTGESGSQEVLLQLEKSNVFLSSLDDEQRWYRLHPLFGDLLRKRLMAGRSEDIPVLHARASQWYQANGFLREAILHALDADDMKQVARLVSGNILILAEGEALPALLERFRSAEKDEICSRPWLCIGIAWAYAYAGQLDEAEGLIDQLESNLPGTMPADDRSHLIGHGMTIRAYVEWIKGRFESAVEILTEALKIIPQDDALERANILINLGLASQNSNNIQAAIQAFRDSMSFSLRADNRYLYIYASSCLVYALKGVGKLHEAVEICQQIENLVDQTGEEHFIQAVSLAAKSEILRLWNDLNGSLIAAQQAVALAEKWKQVDTLHYSLSVLTDAYLALEDYEEARSIIQRSKWIARNVSDWFLAITEFQEAKLNLACENWAPFLQWRQRRGSAKPISRTYYPLLARYLMIQKDYTDEMKVLDEGISALEEAGLWGRTIELYLMKAVAFSALGKIDKALKSLDVGLEMAEPEGYVYLFVIQGKPMENLLRQAVKKDIHREYAQKMLDIIKRESSGRNALKKDQGERPGKWGEYSEPLSDRELEVLRLLNSKLSVPEIAQELTVAPSTVRTHVRVIFNKLGVHGRLEAIEKARELGLL